MTYKQINTMIAAIATTCGCSYAYHHFSEPTTPPFILFLYPDREDDYADNSNYNKVQPIDLLYCSDNADFATENKIEGYLDAMPATYRKLGPDYIEQEKMFQTTFEIEVLLTEEQNSK